MLKIFVEEHPNEAMRTIHASKRFIMTDHRIGGYTMPSDKEPPKKAKQLYARIDRLPLAKEVRIQRAEIHLERNPAFSWDDIIDGIVPIVVKYFGDTEYEVTRTDPAEVERTRQRYRREAMEDAPYQVDD